MPVGKVLLIEVAGLYGMYVVIVKCTRCPGAFAFCVRFSVFYGIFCCCVCQPRRSAISYIAVAGIVLYAGTHSNNAGKGHE